MGNEMRTMIDKVKAIITEGKKTMSDFHRENDIDPENLSYLGSGDFGKAYSIGNDRVLKITTSKPEFDLATQMVNNGAKVLTNGFAKVYVAEVVDNQYLIILEELDTDSSIEDMFYQLTSLLDEQGLPIQYMSNFDDTDHEIDYEMSRFMDGVENILRAYRYMGIEASDIRPENMGYDKDGNLKAFDIDDIKKY